MTTDPARLAVEIDAIDETGNPDWVPNYNVAPTTAIAAVLTEEGARRIRRMRWGLLPPWVKAGADGRPLAKAPMINARAETLTTSPAFRVAARHTRCLVPMDGYYEWKPNPDVPGAAKTPFYLYRDDGRPLLVAGLWSVWQPAGAAAPVSTCTVITTDAVGELARVHDRMPLALAEPDWDRWLAPNVPAPADLLAAAPDVAGITMREVSAAVNKVANNSPELIAPVDHGNQPVGLF